MKTSWWSLLFVCLCFTSAWGQQNAIAQIPFHGNKENLGISINSQYVETKPIISADGKTLYFCRQNHPDNNRGTQDKQDIYYSRLENGQWSPAINMGQPLNDQHPNGIGSVSPDGNSVLLINEYVRGAPCRPGASLSNKTGNTWSFPKKLEIEDFYNFSPYVDYFMSADNKALLLSLQRRHGFGDQDLYVSFEKNGKWSSPLNLGPVINTIGADFAPFLAADGKTLYFASEGHKGFGGSDIFYSKRLDNTWSNWSRPVNLGPAVNSESWDAYYSVSAKGDYAYFVSENEHNNSRDIFRIKLPDQLSPEPVVLVKGKALPLAKGQKIPLNNIFFVRSQSELLPQSYQELDQLVAILNQHPTLEIELGGHTDNLGQASLNFDLSLRRVDAVKEYLVQRGISSNRLHTKGYGDTQPIARNDRELDRRKNRRVEFTILSL